MAAERYYARVRALSKLPCARDNCIGVGALSRHRRRRGLGAFVCDGIARETVEGRGAVSGSLAGMFPARRRASKLVGKRWQFSLSGRQGNSPTNNERNHDRAEQRLTNGLLKGLP